MSNKYNKADLNAWYNKMSFRCGLTGMGNTQNLIECTLNPSTPDEQIDFEFVSSLYKSRINYPEDSVYSEFQVGNVEGTIIIDLVREIMIVLCKYEDSSFLVDLYYTVACNSLNEK